MCGTWYYNGWSTSAVRGGVDLSTFEMERDTDWVKRLLVRFQETRDKTLPLVLTFRMSRKNPKKTFSCLNSLTNSSDPYVLFGGTSTLKQCQIWGDRSQSNVYTNFLWGVCYWKDLPKVTDPVKVSVHDGYFTKFHEGHHVVCEVGWGW
ncbi:hypothetical protein K439DRAFT_1624049 [Ramaria rubella]|nr:hypothetical protein K439DRAFT_1624049 [Ramaria rubella]